LFRKDAYRERGYALSLEDAWALHTPLANFHMEYS